MKKSFHISNFRLALWAGLTMLAMTTSAQWIPVAVNTNTGEIQPSMVTDTLGNVPAGTWRNPEWFTLAWNEAPTNMPDTIAYRTNVDQVIRRQGYNRVRYNRVAQVGEQHSFFDLTFAVTPTSRASITAGGYLTHIADGIVTASVTAATFGRTNVLSLHSAGSVSDKIWDGVTGTVRAATVAAVHGGVTGSTMQTFSTYTTGTLTFVRSTNLWLKPAPECLAAWNSRWGFFRGGVLVTPKHAIGAWHYSPQVGDIMVWVTSNNVATQAVVAAIQNVVSDISIIRLDRNVTSIPRAKFIAEPARFLPTSLVDLPLACGDVHGGVHRMQMVMGSSAYWGTEDGWFGPSLGGAPDRPVWSSLYYHYAVAGDSGQPVFLTTGTDLVLLFCLFYPQIGPDIQSLRSTIQAGIATWGDTNNLEMLNTSAYMGF